MADATVLVLGGGVGGLVVANELRRRLPRSHRITLVDRAADHIFQPSLLWLQVGTRDPGSFSKPLAVLERKGIDVVRGEIERIDPAGKQAVVAGRPISGDHLVVALGAQLAPELIPGLAESGHNLYTLEGATAIRDARRNLTHGRMVVLVARTPFKCPAAPYEAAMLQEYDLRKRKVRDQVSVALYTPEPGPMPVTGPVVSAGVLALLQEHGVSYHPQHSVERVDPESHVIHFANGATATFDLLIYVPPHVPPSAVRDVGLTGPSGWVAVNRTTMETASPDVYAIGDAVGIPLANGMMLPKAGVFAHREAEAVAATIAAKVTGQGHAGPFDGHGECFVETGDGGAAFGRGNFYAEPDPAIRLFRPGRHWHAAKVLFEKDWLRRWF